MGSFLKRYKNLCKFSYQCLRIRHFMPAMKCGTKTDQIVTLVPSLQGAKNVHLDPGIRPPDTQANSESGHIFGRIPGLTACLARYRGWQLAWPDTGADSLLGRIPSLAKTALVSGQTQFPAVSALVSSQNGCLAVFALVSGTARYPAVLAGCWGW